MTPEEYNLYDFIINLYDFIINTIIAIGTFLIGGGVGVFIENNLHITNKISFLSKTDKSMTKQTTIKGDNNKDITPTSTINIKNSPNTTIGNIANVGDLGTDANKPFTSAKNQLDERGEHICTKLKEMFKLELLPLYLNAEKSMKEGKYIVASNYFIEIINMLSQHLNTKDTSFSLYKYKQGLERCADNSECAGFNIVIETFEIELLRYLREK